PLTHHDRDVAQFLPIVAVHHGEEPAEPVLADLAAALVDVVRDIVGEAGEHALAITGVEGVDIAPDKGACFGFAHELLLLAWKSSEATNRRAARLSRRQHLARNSVAR